MKINLSPINTQETTKIIYDFGYFIEKVFWKSFNQYTPAKHLQKWAKQLQYNKNAALLSARKHLKSTIIYAYLMWIIYTKRQENFEILYISYKEDLARYHIANIKKFIEANPLFDCQDLTTAHSEICYSWSDIGIEKLKHKIVIEPAGIMSFKRGRHPDMDICDDILVDPSQELNLTIIDKITRVFFEDIMSLPKEGGEIKLVGTAQHSEDLFFKLKDKKNWAWSMNMAVLDEINKVTLWPEMFSYERLMQIRDEEIGNKAFSKEYMCSPVWSEDAYFKRDEIMELVDKGLLQLKGVMSDKAMVIGGLDLGKARHPSHFTLFLHSDVLIIQIFEVFFDGWDYTKQVNFINAMIETHKIKRIYYDDTRGELEGFKEQQLINPIVWKPVKFTMNEKFKMAANFQKVVTNKSIRFIADDRMIRSILSVNNNLEALETVDGHGDAFWSIALALSYKKSGGVFAAGGGRYNF